MSHGLDPDRAELRASHEDRDRVVERLRDAAGDGRLSADDLDERLEVALTARTHGELLALVRDLPAPAAPAAQELLRLEARQGNIERTGAWVVPRRLEIEAHSGNVVLDFTGATVVHPELDLAVTVKHSNVRLIVPPEVDVDVGTVTVHGGNVRKRVAHGTSGAPVRLRVGVTGSVRYGNVIVRGPRRTFLQWLLRRPPHPRPALPS